MKKRSLLAGLFGKDTADKALERRLNRIERNQQMILRLLQRDAYKAVMAAIELGSAVDRKMADQVALGMKEWANSKGATHYTHWFQPLTGMTAEKHDSFFEMIHNRLGFHKICARQVRRFLSDQELKEAMHAYIARCLVENIIF